MNLRHTKNGAIFLGHPVGLDGEQEDIPVSVRANLFWGGELSHFCLKIFRQRPKKTVHLSWSN